jgi:pimeloyl-ACP methyl ester carboxylesterase
MTYAPVNGLQLYYEIHGLGRPLVLLHGGLLTIDLSFGPLLEPLAAARQVIAVELQGHGHTADTGRPMTIEALAGDVVAVLDHLGIAEADLFGFSLGGLVAFAVALSAPARVGKLIVASADAHRPPGRRARHSAMTGCRRRLTSRRGGTPTMRLLLTPRTSTSSRPGRRQWCTSSRGGGPTSCDHCRCRPC